ncbi:MAG: iduronate-2-sulfatase, partial [Rhodopirellula sp. JB053]
DALVELVDIYPSLCELSNVPIPSHVEGHSFVPLLDDPDQKWKTAAFSQYPNPALREWAANPLSPAMRETWFGPLIKQVENRITEQFPDRWERDLFEKHLTGFTMRTDRYRIVVWKDRRDLDAEPIYVELFDHQTDPHETRNIAADEPDLVSQLLQQFRAGWEATL